MVIRIMLRRLGQCAVYTLIFIVFLFASKASANKSNDVLPNNADDGAGNVWAAVTQPGSNGMNAPEMSANLYVPSSTNSVNLTIENGCDLTANYDVNSTVAESVFKASNVDGASNVYNGEVSYDSIGRFTTVKYRRNIAGNDCNISINLNITNTAVALTFSNGTSYKFVPIRVYLADITNSSTYYMNRFRLRSTTAGALISYTSQPTDPNGTNSRYTGISYSPVSGYSWGWGTKIAYALPCTSSLSTRQMQVYFYDTDYIDNDWPDPNNNPSTPANPDTNPRLYWQNNAHLMKYEIREYDREQYALLGSGASSIIFDQGDLTSGQNGHEATTQKSYRSDKVYELHVYGIGYVNSLQLAIPVTQIYANDPCRTNPVGYADSCALVGNQTVIYGWAFDNTSASDDPRVNLRVTGQADKTLATNMSYRNNEINSFLAANNYGTEGRNNLYGFQATYSGLYKGSSYSISGLIINTGVGSDSNLGINTGAGPPGGGVAGSYGFPANRIPNECLADLPPPLSCEISPIAVGVGEEFYLLVSINNSSGSSVTLSGPANYRVTLRGAAVTNGTGKPFNSSSNTYSDFPITLNNNSSLLIRSVDPALKLTTPGLYDVQWDVAIASGINVGGDCGSVEIAAIDATTRPYTKFFGNDVIAGGGYGDCSATSGINANGYGEFGTPADQTTYRGTASELAVFASGAINGVMPGSQSLIARNPVNELAFANDPSTVDLTTGGLNSPAFGGSFGPTICASDFWNQVPDKTQLTTLPSSTVNLGTLSPGTYYYLGNINITPANINNGTKITIYVEGDTIIGSATADALNSNNPNKYNQTVSYNQPNSSWSDIDKIPLIRIISKGNIYIDNNMSQVDGMYIAVSKDDGSGGEIQTCAQYTSTVFNDLSANDQASKTFIASECNHKLTVYGAFVAKKVKLLRTNGNVLSGVARETSDSVNIAESFVFSPELYLALIADSTAAAGFDAILSLPPAL